MKLLFFSFLLISCFLKAQELRPFQQDSLWGYKNENNEIVIKPEYQYAKKFYLDFAIVYKNDSVGLINKKNKIILPFKYNYLQYLSPTTYMYGYQAKYFGEFNSGIIDLNGKKLSPPLYYNINFIENKYFVTTQKNVETTEGPLAGMHETYTKYGVLDKNGKIIIPVIYDNAQLVDIDRIVVGDTRKNVDILFNDMGKQLTNENYNSINLFYADVASVGVERLCGYINKNGKIAIPIVYSACYPFYKDKAIVSQNFKFVIIDKKANPISKEFSYEEIQKYLKDNNLEIMMDEFRFMNRKN